jgi:rare lipoprotein A
VADRRNFLRTALAALALLALAACGGGDGYSPYGGTDEPTQVKIGKPYQVKGETYTPQYEPGYDETGMASWYGPQFHGRMTASGEKYDQYEMTAAHRTLPMPAVIRVTRLDSGKSVEVRVNDRGPFAHGRILDLSQAAARELDMVRDGTARVRVQYLHEATERYIADRGLARPKGWKAPPMTRVAVRDSVPAEVPAAPSFSFGVIASAHAAPSLEIEETQAYRIQAASFREERSARRVADALRDLAATRIQPAQGKAGTAYRVSLGPISRYAEAQRLLAEVRGMGYPDARVLVER